MKAAKALTCAKNVAKYLLIGAVIVSALLTIAGVFSSCSSVKKNKRSVDSTARSSFDSGNVKIDKGTVSELKEGEYEKVTIEYDTVRQNIRTEEKFGKTYELPIIPKLGVKRVTYERGKTKEQRTEVKDSKDSGHVLKQQEVELKKTEKIVNKSRLEWFPIILILLGIVAGCVGYRYLRYGRLI